MPLSNEEIKASVEKVILAEASRTALTEFNLNILAGAAFQRHLTYSKSILDLRTALYTAHLTRVRQEANLAVSMNSMLYSSHWPAYANNLFAGKTLEECAEAYILSGLSANDPDMRYVITGAAEITRSMQNAEKTAQEYSVLWVRAAGNLKNGVSLTPSASDPESVQLKTKLFGSIAAFAFGVAPRLASEEQDAFILVLPKNIANIAASYATMSSAHTDLVDVPESFLSRVPLLLETLSAIIKDNNGSYALSLQDMMDTAVALESF